LDVGMGQKLFKGRSNSAERHMNDPFQWRSGGCG